MLSISIFSLVHPYGQTLCMMQAKTANRRFNLLPVDTFVWDFAS
jgi:hypothetical protein